MTLSLESDNPKVNLLDLSASCLSSAVVAADQITALACTNSETVGERTITENKKNARLKIDGTYVTDADLLAQQIIVDALHKVSCEIRIVGEESEEEMRSRTITGHEGRLESICQLAREEILIRYDIEHQQQQNIDNTRAGDEIDLPLSQRQRSEHDSRILGEQEHFFQSDKSLKTEDSSACGRDLNEIEIDANRVSVFIDPLDGTNSYAKGDHDPVSILVAIILDENPCFGVICKPFGYPERTSVLDTGCVAVYGGTLLGGAYIAGGCAIGCRNNEFTRVADDLPDDIHRDYKDLPRAVISRSRHQGVVQKFVTYLGDRGIIHPEPLLVSGAGEKSLRIITGFENEGLWFFPKGGTSLWDVAASDALLRVTGGRLTDKYGNNMDYSKSRKEAENHNGVVACFDENLHADCIRIFLDGSWEDI